MGKLKSDTGKESCSELSRPDVALDPREHLTGTREETQGRAQGNFPASPKRESGNSVAWRAQEQGRNKLDKKLEAMGWRLDGQGAQEESWERAGCSYSWF